MTCPECELGAGGGHSGEPAVKPRKMPERQTKMGVENEIQRLQDSPDMIEMRPADLEISNNQSYSPAASNLQVLADLWHRSRSKWAFKQLDKLENEC